MKYNYLFGPLPSRRLGQSLGIDVIPGKTCSMNCVYCEVGRTTKLTNDLQPFCPAEDVIAELDHFFGAGNQADYLTLCGSGEPTLWADMGHFIQMVKERYSVKVAIITNSLLLHDERVIKNCLGADLIMPSLDSMLQDSFLRLNRPAAGTDCREVARALKAFRQRFEGQMWLEILLIAGFNDSAADIAALKEAIVDIAPDQVQLNTLVRPGVEDDLQPLAHAELVAIAEQLSSSGQRVEVISSYRAGEKMSRADVLSVLKRRPCTEVDLHLMLGEDPRPALDGWLQSAAVTAHRVGDELFYAVD